MKKPILITLLCAGLMLITPFTVVAQENKVSNNLIEYPDDVEELVAQIRTVVNDILQKYGYIPKVSNLCNMILNSLGLLENLIICIFFIILLIPVTLLLIITFYFGPGDLHYEINLLCIIILVTMGDYCTPYNAFISKLPLKTIYNLKDTDDITNLAKDCPCLQE